MTCHANVAHDLEIPKTNRPEMESCYSCHSRTDSCAKCHTSGIPPAPPARETVGRKPVAPPRATGGESPKPPGEGRQLYAKFCGGCHGADGGSLPVANLKSRGYLESLGAERLIQSTTEGKGAMPPYGVARGGPLGDEDVKTIVEYLLSAAE